MKKPSIAVLTLLVSVPLLATEVSEFRLAISNAVVNADKDNLYTFTIGEIGGQHICRHPSYQALAAMISNDWQYVLSNIGSIATNQTERCLVLGTGFQYGWDFYLPFFTRVAEECLAGNITSNEVAWFEAYSTKPGLVDQLYERHNDSSVTNLLWKMIQIDGDTNRWSAIMSDDALLRLEELQFSGTLYIPE